MDNYPYNKSYINGVAQTQAQTGALSGTLKGYLGGINVVGNVPDNEPTSFLGEVYGQISAATKEVLDIADGARSTADAVFGSRPEANTASTGKPRESGRAADIREQIELLHGAISMLRDEVRRLRAL